MDDKLVSVIIPTFKRSDKLTRAIVSVLNQTYKNLEIIVVDDNDNDTTYRNEVERIMKEFQDDPRVRYIQHPYNKNGAAARNTGINISSGSYISFLDDDDYYLPNKIENEVEYLETNKNYNAVYCGRYQKGKKILPNLDGDLSEEILLLTFTPTTPALMFRSHVLKEMKGFNENFKRHQDFELLLRYFENHEIGVIKDPLVVIGQNEGENELHGEVLENNKKAFFKQFEEKIKNFDRENKGFEKKLYVAHYSPVFWDHVSQKKILLAVKTYTFGIKISPLLFNVALLKHVFRYLSYLMNRKRENNDFNKTIHTKD